MRPTHQSAIEAMVTAPAASPSSPSIRLMALMTSSTQTTVSGALKTPEENEPPKGLVRTGTP